MASKQGSDPSANTAPLIFSEGSQHMFGQRLLWQMLIFKSKNVFSSGVDVTANQEEISNHETFQLEFDPKAAKWAIRTMQDKYFR